MRNIAIDIGYGDIKVCVDKKSFKFINAISFSGNSSVNYSQNALKIYKFNDLDYLVGEEALINNPFVTRDYSYLYEYAPLLVYKALKDAEIKVDDNIQIITGLSLKDWHKAEEFGERLCNIFVNNEHINISPENIKIVPQGKGIYVDFKSSNKIVENDFFAIVDIGYNTFDFLMFKDGKPIPNKNYANTLGVNTLIQEVQKYISKEYHIHLSEQECKDVLLKKSLRIGSKYHDLTTTINNEIKKYSKLRQNEVIAKNSDLINKVFNVIISGGGAYLLNEINAQMFEHQIYSKSPYEFANVRGYYMDLKDE